MGKYFTRTVRYTTTLNPAAEIMFACDMVYPHGYYTHAWLSVLNVDLGATLTVLVSPDDLEGTYAAAHAYMYVRAANSTVEDNSPTVATTARSPLWMIQVAVSSADFLHPMPPRINIIGTATVAAGKFVDITMHLMG